MMRYCHEKKRNSSTPPNTPVQCINTPQYHLHQTKRTDTSCDKPPSLHLNSTMLGQVDSVVAPLRQVLEDGEWRSLRSALNKLPKKVSTKSPALSVETMRVAADILIEECAVSTAFERAYIARQALHECGISNWVVPCLQAVSPSSVVARRLVTLVESLATTEIGRSALGKARCVTALVEIWSRAPRGAKVPAALCALCSGHIDNISRVMRYGGVGVAAAAIRSAMNESDSGAESRRTIECSLLLLGLASICVPDLRTGATELVPLVREVVQYARDNNERMVLAHAINIIGNVAECWRKEGRGFEIADHQGLVSDTLDAWCAEPRDRRVVSAAAWALTGLIRAHDDVALPTGLDQVLANSSKSAGAVRALRKLVEEIRAKEAEKAVAAASAKKSRKRKLPTEHDDDDVVIVETRIKRVRTNADVPATPRKSSPRREVIDIVEQTPTRIGGMSFDEVPIAAFANNDEKGRRRSSRSPTRHTQSVQ